MLTILSTMSFSNASVKSTRLSDIRFYFCSPNYENLCLIQWQCHVEVGNIEMKRVALPLVTMYVGITLQLM